MRLPAHVLQTLTDRLGAEELRRALLPYPDSETTVPVFFSRAGRPPIASARAWGVAAPPPKTPLL